jgi:hypothetical protein
MYVEYPKAVLRAYIAPLSGALVYIFNAHAIIPIMAEGHLVLHLSMSEISCQTISFYTAGWNLMKPGQSTNARM